MTSFSRTYKRDIILVEAQGDGISGWGEVTAGENPFYNEEWTGSAWLVLRDYAAPRVVGREIGSAQDVAPLTRHIRGHLMARGGLKTAVWDLEARRDGVPLWRKIGGGARREIPCGVSIGIQDSVEQLLEKIAGELSNRHCRPCVGRQRCQPFRQPVQVPDPGVRHEYDVAASRPVRSQPGAVLGETLPHGDEIGELEDRRIDHHQAVRRVPEYRDRVRFPQNRLQGFFVRIHSQSDALIPADSDLTDRFPIVMRVIVDQPALQDIEHLSGVP